MPAKKPPASPPGEAPLDRAAGAGTRAADVPPAAREGSPGEPRISRIVRRAHEIYLARGGAEGKAVDDWLQAEREIDAEIERDGGGQQPRRG